MDFNILGLAMIRYMHFGLLAKLMLRSVGGLMVRVVYDVV